MDLFAAAGPWLIPLLATAACLAVTVGRALGRSLSGAPSLPLRNATLVWGGVAALVGVIGTVVGASRLATGLGSVLSDEPQPDEILDVLASGAGVVGAPLAIGAAILVASLLSWLALGFLDDRVGLEEVASGSMSGEDAAAPAARTADVAGAVQDAVKPDE